MRALTVNEVKVVRGGSATKAAVDYFGGLIGGDVGYAVGGFTGFFAGAGVAGPIGAFALGDAGASFGSVAGTAAGIYIADRYF